MHAGFGWALNQLREGRKVKRSGWDKVLSMTKEEKLYIGTPDGQHIEPYVIEAFDVLAQDWTSVPQETKEKVDSSGAW